jgi:hypothetical protein
MKTSTEINVGSIVRTVSPTGKPNVHTSRIGRGRVVELFTQYDGASCKNLPYAFVCFFDGKRGSWPVEQLQSCGR